MDRFFGFGSLALYFVENLNDCFTVFYRRNFSDRSQPFSAKIAAVGCEAGSGYRLSSCDSTHSERCLANSHRNAPEQSISRVVSTSLGIEQLRVWSNWLQARLPGQIIDHLPSIDDLTQETKTLFRWNTSHIYLLSFNYISLIINGLLITVLTIIMLLVNPMPYRHATISLFPAFYRQRADEILSKCEEGLMGWQALH